MKLNKVLILSAILLGLILLIHNAINYPVNGGYDFGLHANYAKIISHQWRLPALSETREAYNPPLFYLISGLIGRLTSQITKQDFILSLKIWQYLSVALTAFSLYLWYKIINYLHPKNKPLQLLFIILTFSLPVFQKTIVMFSIENLLLFFVSLTFWYFIFFFLRKPYLKQTIILAGLMILGLLTRPSAFVLLATIIIGILGWIHQKKIPYKQAAKVLIIFIITISLGAGWFYCRGSTIYDIKSKPLSLQQAIPFYTEVPFRLIMSYPIRFAKHTPLNRFIPIFYSEFWGDWWNYYSQRRFGISVEARKNDHYLTNSNRVSSLALQNQINLPPTLIIIVGVLYQVIVIIKTPANKQNKKWLIKLMFIFITLFTWMGFFYTLTFHPTWKSDTVKASYMLYNIPIFIYFSVVFIFDILKKHQIIFIPTIIWLTLATSINLWWSWY